MTDADFVAFLQDALPRLGLRWAGFRRVRRQVRKRLSRRLAELGLESLEEYERRLRRDPAEWDVLDGLCRVTISRFYRDRAVFDALRDSVLPDLAAAAERRGEPVVRAWSVGCASGEEPYTLSLVWSLGPAASVGSLGLEILATDADARLLERARRACYPPGSLKELPPAWTDEAFRAVDGSMCLRARYREPVELERQDVRKQVPEGRFDLVLCRNLVFTYFESSVQVEVLRCVLRCLVPDGVLVLGGHERLPDGRWPLKRVTPLPLYRKHGPEPPTSTPGAGANLDDDEPHEREH